MQLFAYLCRGGIPQRPDATIEHVCGCGKDRFRNQLSASLNVDHTQYNRRKLRPDKLGHFVGIDTNRTMISYIYVNTNIINTDIINTNIIRYHTVFLAFTPTSIL